MAAREQIDKANAKARELLKAAGIVITEEEAKRIEYCDYHLGEFDTIGTEILTYVNTDRVCAKEMMLTPYQICPEHLHPQLGDYQGKEETFRSPLGRGLPLCSRGAYGAAAGKSSGASEGAFYRVA